MFGSTLQLRPAEPPSPPPVMPVEIEVVQTGWARFVGLTGSPVELPGDFAIRELREAGSDDAALVDFIGQWGLLHEDGPACLDLLPPWFLRVYGTPAMIDVAEAAVTKTALISLDLSRIHMAVLRALADVYLGRALEDHRQIGQAWRAAGFSIPKGEATWRVSQRMAARVISAAVVGFGVEAAFEPDPLPPFQANVFTAAVLQLAQAMAPSGRTVLRCQNERCGRAFTRQRGRAVYQEQQHSMGVKYCSSACAKAQLERNRRARLKEAR